MDVAVYEARRYVGSGHVYYFRRVGFEALLLEAAFGEDVADEPLPL